ncbi:MAG: EamA family transporter, partial [Promethearchaeota archaeon]
MIGSYLLLVVMILLWSFSFIIVDIAVEFAPPLSIALYRFIIASISFFFIDFYLKVIKKSDVGNEDSSEMPSEPLSKSDWILVIFSSFSGISLFFYSQYNAINLIGPSLPALFVCLLSPVLIAVLALVFFDEKLNKIKILGFIIATIGGYFLVTGGNINTLTPQSPNFIGYFFALLTPILWAIYSTLTKKIKGSNYQMLKYVCFLGTIELFFLVLLTGELLLFIEGLVNLPLFLYGLYLGLCCYVIGFFIWQKSQKKMKSS